MLLEAELATVMTDRIRWRRREKFSCRNLESQRLGFERQIITTLSEEGSVDGVAKKMSGYSESQRLEFGRQIITTLSEEGSRRKEK